MTEKHVDFFHLDDKAYEKAHRAWNEKRMARFNIVKEWNQLPYTPTTNDSVEAKETDTSRLTWQESISKTPFES